MYHTKPSCVGGKTHAPIKSKGARVFSGGVFVARLNEEERIALRLDYVLCLNKAHFLPLITSHYNIFFVLNLLTTNPPTLYSDIWKFNRFEKETAHYSPLI